MDRSIDSQKGSAILVSLMVLLAVTLLGIAVIGIAGMETKMAVNDIRTEEARQAADAGIQVARDMVMNHMIAGIDIPAIPQISLSPNTSSTVSVSLPDSKGIVTITSQGKITDTNGNILARKTARAEVFVSGLPNQPIRTNKLKAMGKYYTAMDWNAAKSEKRLKADLPWPSQYPLYGPAHNGSSDADGLNPHNYSYWIDYDYLCQPGTGLKIAHWLPETYLNLAPYYLPQGKINIVDEYGQPAPVTINQWADDITTEETNELFYRADLNQGIMDIWGVIPNVTTYEPDKLLRSEDFLGKYLLVSNPQILKFDAEQLQLFREAALSHPDEWQYVDKSDSAVLCSQGAGKYKLVVDQVDKPNIFVDWDRDADLDQAPEDFTVVADFTTISHNNGPEWVSWDWLRHTIADLQNTADTWVNRLSNEYDNLVIVTPANIEVGYDSTLFDMVNSEAAVFLLSTHNVDIRVDPKQFNGLSRIMPEDEMGNREMRLFSLAGENIKITSTPQNITYKGVINAGNTLTIAIDYYDDMKITSMNKTIDIVQQPSIISQFPEPWAYIGVGPIVSYKYLD